MNRYHQLIRNRVKATVHKLQDTYYTKLCPLDITAYVTPEPLSYDNRTQGQVCKLKEGDSWGGLFDCAWFHFQGQVPIEAKGQKTVLLIDVNGEGCIFNDRGEAVLGLTSGTSVYQYETSRKRVVPMSDCAAGDEIVDLWMDAGNNDLFGRYTGNGTVVEAQVAVADDALRSLYYDFALLDNVLDNMDDNSPRYYEIMYAANRAIDHLDMDNMDIDGARAILKAVYDKKNGDVSLRINAVGHAHIDLAWLWPIRETIRKGARTFATALALMDKYPDYKFGASQPQLYAWIKELYPSLYARIKERIREGRWEIQGAMWVEADTNVSGGEALIRQVLYGTRFYRDEFDMEVNNLWLPDVFGYSGALPQILKKSNIPYFMTIKLSWSKINKFPYHTFVWKGIDGSDVLCHMPPEGNYNAAANATSLCEARDNFSEKGLSDEVLMLYGIGNGGGGPAAHHQERLNRLENFQGLPPVEQGFAGDFFDRINEKRDDYPSWKGELYLETHRGTYTTQAKNKKYNRMLELLLREAEMLSVWAMKSGDYVYPQAALERIWKEVLLYQFHDILPGSSIKRVYDESVERYQVLEQEVRTLITDAAQQLTSDAPDQYTMFNSLGWQREGWTQVNGQWMHYDAKPLSSATLELMDAIPTDPTATAQILENAYIRVTFDENGAITSIYDKKQAKEMLQPGQLGNVLSVYHDIHDAWDLDIGYANRPVKAFQLVESKAITDGPQAVMEQQYAYGKSTIKQRIILTDASPVVEFDTQVDWHEKEKMLRTAFPLDVYADDAVCNIQFGSIKRPTHTNTSWDQAKFEICAHKWVDISDGTSGMALMNDSKYGHKVHGNVLDINLLRGTQYPGEDADQGEHHFRYAVYPHAGDCYQAQVERQAMALNIQPVVMKGCGIKAVQQSLIQLDKPSIVVETVKKCEDSDDIIIRLYESSGKPTQCQVKMPMRFNTVQLTDMMENPLESIAIEENEISLSFKAFDILTLKIIG